MQQASGKLAEIYLENGMTAGRMRCPPALVPAPGQYLLAHDPASNAPLPAPVFRGGLSPGGFLLAPPIPDDWRAGVSLLLRGPLGHGFDLPGGARRVALVALDGNPYRLLALLDLALAQGADVTFLGETVPSGLPVDVEARPLSALPEAAQWADYLALDLARESLLGVRQRLGIRGQAGAWKEAQALVVTPMPCGGMASCGVCAVRVRHGRKLACKDGPVFRLGELGDFG